MTLRRALRSLLLVGLPGLAACGQDPASLNSQGYRALRYDAVLDAEAFFRFAAERADKGPDRIAPDDPERRRTEIGKLAVGAWLEPDATLEELSERLTADPAAFTDAELELIGVEYADAHDGPAGALLLGLLESRGAEPEKLDERRRELVWRSAWEAVDALRLGL